MYAPCLDGVFFPCVLSGLEEALWEMIYLEPQPRSAFDEKIPSETSAKFGGICTGFRNLSGAGGAYCLCCASVGCIGGAINASVCSFRRCCSSHRARNSDRRISRPGVVQQLPPRHS